MDSRSRSDRLQSRRLSSRSSGCCEAWRYHSRSHGSRYLSRDHYRSYDCSPLSSDRSRSRERSWRPERSRWDREEAVVASWDRCNSGSTVEPTPAVAGGSIPLPMSSFPDLVRLFLSLSGPVAQRDAAVGSLLTGAGVTGAAWPCRSGAICSPCCLLICECARSRCVDFRWCSLCVRFARSM